MKDDAASGQMDPRVHAYLDGEMSPAEAAAFEGELRTGRYLRNQVNSLKHTEVWSQATRPRPPSNLADAVLAQLARERLTRTETRSSPPRGWRSRGLERLQIRPQWALAVAALAVALALVLLPRDRATVPSGGVTPPEGAAVTGGAPAPSAVPDRVRYEFTFRATEAREVCLAGDFNRWTVCRTPLKHVGEDLWSVSLELTPGRYEYMFVVDGRWVLDPQARHTVDDGFGSQNGLLVI